METQDISPAGLLASYALILVPVLFFSLYKVPLIVKSLVAILRMSVQLLFVGIYLKYVFLINNFWLNAAWILVMILVANVNVTSSIGTRRALLFPITLAGIALGTLPVVAVFMLLVVRPVPAYDARYIIPITGMILGNCLRGNIIGLERFFSHVKTSENEYLSRLFMGATPLEASQPFVVHAVTSALSPTIATMATLGLVSLPGMMTGQILGGSLPLVAIKYQIAIMLAIFASTCLGVFTNIYLATRLVFDDYGIPKPNLFRA